MNERRRRFEIPASLAGERLDRALSLLTGRSRSETAKMVADGCVLIDGEVSPVGSRRLAPNEVVEVLPEQAPDAVIEREPEIVPFDVLYADADVVVVNKPSGVVTHPGSGHSHGTLADALVTRFPDMAEVGQPDRPGIVHRLDRGTSGALVCARSPLAYEGLIEQISRREVRRIYAALARGHPPSPRGTIDARIGRDPHNRTLMAVMATGREARTHYSTVELFTYPVEASLLRCQLSTGRTHQIRVHLASIGLPLLGDLAYGVPDPFGISRPLLHASQLTFQHPASGAEMSVAAPMPADFVEALREFGSDPSAFSMN
ncbi:RluA family pseudouridine synthase [Candidatus Poriferisodalis sp.]|uniref:RluA family pseudouridine synthase n=1 Tax=Candidatus Poriferisodalis sp. TaxID=3101277 RepID=UPI003C6F6B5B